MCFKDSRDWGEYYHMFLHHTYSEDIEIYSHHKLYVYKYIYLLKTQLKRDYSNEDMLLYY